MSAAFHSRSPGDPSAARRRRLLLSLALGGGLLGAAAPDSVLAKRAPTPETAADTHPFDQNLKVRKLPGNRVRLTYAATTTASVSEIETYLAYRAATATLAASGQSFIFRSRDAEPATPNPAGPRYSFRMAEWRPVWRASKPATAGRPSPPGASATAQPAASGPPRDVHVVAEIEVRRQRYDGLLPRGFDPWALVDHLRPQVFNQATTRPALQGPGY